MNPTTRRSCRLPISCLLAAAVLATVLAPGLATVATVAQAQARVPADPEPVVDLRTLLAVDPLQGWRAPLDPDSGRVLRPTALVIASQDLADGWLELTPLSSEEPAAVVRLGDRSTADGGLRMPPMGVDGTAVLCSGGARVAVLCEQIYLESEVWLATGESADIEVSFELGRAVAGRYLLDGGPVAEARVAAVPAGLETGRAFTVPLGPGGRETGALRREVESDDDGRFELPPLATGEYFLETVLPSGRVHRSEPFLVPPFDATRGEAAAAVELGEIDVADGLVVSFQVLDWQGEPLAGALVAARQGATVSTLVRFETTTDDAGRARLSGLTAERAVHLSCHKPGYRKLEREEPLLPVLFNCALQPLASVAGEATGIDGQVPPGLTVSLTAHAATGIAASSAVAQTGSAWQPSSRTLPQAVVPVDAEGGFAASDLAAGSYRLAAAAPGFETATREVVLEPGQRLAMEPMVLTFGRRLVARVVEKGSERPLAGVEITAVAPPGAVSAVSDGEGVARFADPGDEALVLRLSAAEHASRDIALSARHRAEQQPLLFEMERAGWIRAWVGEARSPCQGCRLVLQPSGTELSTDGTGEALSEPLLPGRYRVHRPRVTHLGSSVVEQDDAEVRSVRVRAGELTTVRFGEQLRRLRLRFTPSLPPSPSGAPWSLSVRARRHVERYWPEADGSFVVDQPSQARVQLFLQTYDAASDSEMEIWQADLRVEAGRREANLAMGSATVTGQASVAGEPLVGVWMHLKTLDNAIAGSVKTRADGSFHLPYVPAGIYAVAIGDLNVKFASLRPGVTLDLGAFHLVPGGF